VSQGAPEEWRVIPSFPDYSASSWGRIKRTAVVIAGWGAIQHRAGTLKQRALPRGHMQVTLSMNNKRATCLVHRLVAEAFLPPPPPDKNCVCHRDDTPSNNRPENLFWGDRPDNSQDMVSKDRQAKGERVAGSKLTADDVMDIRRLYADGADQRDIAALYGIAQSNVSLIVTRATWKHVI
jgi:HNH endonuclease